MDEFQAGTAFLSGLTEGPVAVIMDGDADGLSGGRLVCLTLEARRIEAAPVFPGKGQHAYSPEVQQTVRGLAAKAVVIVDSGASGENPYRPRPVLVLDHHQPLGIPPEATFVSSYRHQPPETSSVIAFRVCRPLADLSKVAWLAVLGAFGDLGGADDFPDLAEVAKGLTKSSLKKTVSLINAARRSSRCDVAAAYEALASASDPRDVAGLKTPAARKLERYRREVKTALDLAAGQPPEFGKEIALVRCHTPCLVHGVLASRWAHRLKPYPALVVNTGYFPEEAVFSFRSAGDVDLIGLLRERLGPDEHLGGTIGYGHRAATGGRFPLSRLPEFLAKMGLAPARRDDRDTVG